MAQADQAQTNQIISAYATFWIVLAGIAMFNGLMREMSYGQQLSELAAHQLSTLIAIGVMASAVFLFQQAKPITRKSDAWTIGTLWVMQTVSFELLFGRFVADHSWSELLADYNIFAGRIWILLLIALWAMPYGFYRLHKLEAGKRY